MKVLTFSLLTTIVSQDPIYVDFDADERSVVRLRKAAIARDGVATPERLRDAQVPVLVALGEQNDFTHKGMIDFLDNRIDPSTGRKRNPFSRAVRAQLLIPSSKTASTSPLPMPVCRAGSEGLLAR